MKCSISGIVSHKRSLFTTWRRSRRVLGGWGIVSRLPDNILLPWCSRRSRLLSCVLFSLLAQLSFSPFNRALVALIDTTLDAQSHEPDYQSNWDDDDHDCRSSTLVKRLMESLLNSVVDLEQVWEFFCGV